MKNITTFAALCALSVGAAKAAETDPVGYITIPLPGTGGGQPEKLQIANQGLLPGDSLETSGTVTSFGSDGTGDFLEDTSSTWSAGDFVNGTQVSHLIEITAVDGGDASLVGQMTYVTSSDTNKLYTQDDISAAGAGASYRVLKTFTVASLFGAVPDAATLGGGTNATAADNVLILDPVTNVYTTFWYKNGGIGGTGWRAAGIANADVPTTSIHPNDGLVIQRKQSGDGSLVIAGSVKTTDTVARIEGDGATEVLNIVALPVPTDQLTIDGTGLYTGDDATGLKGGTNATAADNLLIFDAVTNTYTTFWYKDGGIGGTGWRASGIADPANFVIPSTGSILIQRKAGPAFGWSIPGTVVGE